MNSAPAAPSTDVSSPERGVLASLRAAVGAALVVGLVFGIADACVADARTHPPFGLVGYVGCFAAAGLSYSLVAVIGLAAAALALHPWLASREPAARLRALLALGIAAGLFLELYWWTRPYVFYGRSSVSPERLGAAAGQALAALACGYALAALLVRLPRAVHATVRALGLAAVVAGAVFLVWERQKVAARGVLTERNRELPNVLLVVVDALRADVLGCYGHPRVETPVIDGLARRGVLFENCFVQAPYTWTSFGSILTGKYPRRHGLIAQKPGVRMVQSNVTLPFHLKSARLKTARHADGVTLTDEDWVTGTFMTGALSHGSGLDRGFDAYTEALLGHDLVEVDSQWSVFRSELLLWIFKNKIQQRVDSSLVVTLARRWLRKNADRRWMAMVHLYSTHTPYDPPAEFQAMYVDPAYDGPIDAFYSYHREAIEAGTYPPTEADVRQVQNLYYAGVTQADFMIGELLDELEELGVLEETLVIVTADHGEDLGEREGYWEHNHMWQTNLRVPLVMANSYLLPHGERVSALVESIDIFPTVCDLLGLELPPAPEGDPRARIDGKSMRPLVRDDGTVSIKDWSFSENALFASVQNLERKLIVPRHGAHDLMAPSTDEQALFDPRHGVLFFDLARDPDELENLVASPEHALEILHMYQVLREWSDSLPVPEADNVSTPRDREHLELLMRLGYTGMLEEQAVEERTEPAEGAAEGERK